METAALQAVLRGRVYDLGQPLQMGMPMHPAHPPFVFTLMRRHGDLMRDHGCSTSNELIVMSGHSGTHFDAISHVSEEGRLFGGVDAHANQAGVRGHKEHGLHTVEPVVARGVLLDVASARGVPCLPAASPIGADELADTARRQGVEVRRGDVVLVRTGWIRHWRDRDTFLGTPDGIPGVDESGAAWLVAQGARAAGADTILFEVMIPGGTGLPVHVALIARAGVPIMENVNLDGLAADRVYEFLFVTAPLKLVGATGSPVRPIVIA